MGELKNEDINNINNNIAHHNHYTLRIQFLSAQHCYIISVNKRRETCSTDTCKLYCRLITATHIKHGNLLMPVAT